MTLDFPLVLIVNIVWKSFCVKWSSHVIYTPRRNGTEEMTKRIVSCKLGWNFSSGFKRFYHYCASIINLKGGIIIIINIIIGYYNL